MNNTEPYFIILAAGMGTRLGGAVPKPLTVLNDGRTILQQQIDNIAAVFGQDALKRIHVIVGFQAETVVGELPRGVKPVYNPYYDMSNTARSLVQGLQSIRGDRGVVWMNGDVVFSPFVLSKAVALIENQSSFMAAMEGITSDEEMKYTLDGEFITVVSKQNMEGVGEAVGINYIAPQDKAEFARILSRQPDQAYFEAAIEESLKFGMKWKALPINEFYAVEVDFIEDLHRANAANIEA